MKNVDVPMWDKGDSTDSYAKGGPKNAFSFGSDNEDNSEEIKKIYLLVLGREPSSRELSFYKYSVFNEEKLIKKLLDSDEHKKIIEKALEHPSLVEKSKLAENSILKLRTFIEDRNEEFSTLQRLLEEKNSIINDLRESKESPYLTDRRIVDQGGAHYGVSRDDFTPRDVESDSKRETLLERIINLFFEK